MATEKQIQANRRNAQMSTGPKSESGKAVAKINATTHGLTAETIVIKDEDPEEFEKLRDALMNEFQPKTVLAYQLVERAAELLWRLRRVPQIEASVMEVNRVEAKHLDAKGHFSVGQMGAALDAQDEIDGSQISLGRAFMRAAQNQDVLGKLDRHESSLVRLLDATLKQLERENARIESARVTEVIDLQAVRDTG